jgi:ribosomal protein L14E/L6E/L27E
MAKKRQQLEFIDIVMGADSETIKKAYEARIKIDDQLILREEAYKKIAELEQQVEEIVGQKGEFIFPAPPLPVAGYSKLIPASRPAPRPAKVEGYKESKEPSKDESVKTSEVKNAAKATNKKPEAENDTAQKS